MEKENKSIVESIKKTVIEKLERNKISEQLASHVDTRLSIEDTVEHEKISSQLALHLGVESFGIEEKQDDYNFSSKDKMDLVFFNQAIYHILRITRILR